MVKAGFLEKEALRMGLGGHEEWVHDEVMRRAKALGRKEQSVCKELPDECEHRSQV